MFNKQRCSRHVTAGALALLALGWLLAVPKPAEAGCWSTAPLCQFVSSYAVTYNGGSCGGSYDIAFTLKPGGSFSGVCGNGAADFWSMSDGGSGYDENIDTVKVYPNDTTCSRNTPFIAYIKVKALDTQGNGFTTGTDPSPYFIDPRQFTYAGETIQVSCP